MTTRTAHARWEGPLATGKGTVSLDSSNVGAFDVSWPARTEAPQGVTSPEELIAAAHSACFSMALSHALASAGNPPQQLDTTADVVFDKTGDGWGITGITLRVTGRVPGMSAQDFVAAAEGAKAGCPVSKALAAVPIGLEATLAE